MNMQGLNLPLNRDLFFRKMIRSFAKSLEETVGLDEAAGYVALVGSEVGNWIEEQYRESAGKEQFTPHELAELLVDLKRQSRPPRKTSTSRSPDKSLDLRVLLHKTGVMHFRP